MEEYHLLRKKSPKLFITLCHELGLEELSEIVCNYHAKCQIMLKMGTDALSMLISSGLLMMVNSSQSGTSVHVMSA